MIPNPPRRRTDEFDSRVRSGKGKSPQLRGDTERNNIPEAEQELELDDDTGPTPGDLAEMAPYLQISILESGM